MNVTAAVYEIGLEEFNVEPKVIALDRPFSLQSTADHFLAVFGYFSVGELHNIDTFSDSIDTTYVDTKGIHSDIDSILDGLYEPETKKEVGIFREDISRVKKSPHYDDSIKNEFKNSIVSELDI